MANDKLSNFETQVGALTGGERLEFTQDALTKFGTPDDLRNYTLLTALIRNANLGDVQNAETSLANLNGLSIANGLSSASNLSDVADAGTSLDNIGGLASVDGLLRVSNLSDVADPVISLDNIGGLAKTQNLSDVDNPNTSLTNINGLSTTDGLHVENNLDDVASAAISLRNLGGLFFQANLIDVEDSAISLDNINGLSTLGGVMTGPFKITEKPTAEPAIGEQGEYWVRIGNPNTPMYTDENGTDYELNEASTGGDMLGANNLSDVSNSVTSLLNIGGLASVQNLADVQNAVTALANLNGLSTTTGLVANSNLSDVQNPTTSLNNIGGLAAAANLSDVANAATALANLNGLSTSTGLVANANLADVQNTSTSLSNIGGAALAGATFTGRVDLSNNRTVFSGGTTWFGTGDTEPNSLYIQFVTNNGLIADEVHLRPRGGDGLRVFSDGKVEIDTGALDLGDFSDPGTSNGSTFTASGRTRHSSASVTTNSGHTAYYNPNGNVGAINTNGTTTAYATTSDYRRKENDVDITDGKEKIMALRPINFNFISDPSETVEGFFAHEVESICPRAIVGEKDAVDETGKPIYQMIDESKLVSLLVAGLQDAFREIEELRNG